MAQLLKVHGSENQFFILDQTALDHKLSADELTHLAQTICKPTSLLGGADGVLVVDQSDHKAALGRMEVVNADGSRASMCGNGLRCVSRYIADHSGKDSFKVETPAADLLVNRQPNLADNVFAFAVEISPVRYQKEAFPFDHLGMDQVMNQPLPALNDHLKFTTIAVPNPHLISFVDNDHDLNDTLGTLGKQLNEPNQYFPDGVNVNFAKILGQNQLFVRTYERGVGFTNACGTGMSATSLAFALNYPDMVDVNQPIEVTNPGGMVKTIVHPNDEHQWIELIGNATFTHQIDVDEAKLHAASVTADSVQVHDTGEEASYQAFIKSLQLN
ncbi:diaminopimelate epimerase [Nicoliella spurrieriana]|uniref:Diaminopimelate epimerase n=1 Tax=Nicoliella spurrieriana TaxID=2925830 RepID=A0A976RQX6_9LACO|nr:diaminopimelate epimerase [Nicoliella spurrieriana]UQS86255.1 diaminopimelate epimerase [Nicoliella spurrieriana]